MRLILRIGSLILLLMLLGGVAVVASNFRMQRRANALLKAVRDLQPGESTFSDTETIRVKYGAQKDPGGGMTGSTLEESYSISLATKWLNALAYRHPALWRFGLKPSGVLVILRFREQKLSYLSYSFATIVFPHSDRAVTVVDEATLNDGTQSRENGNGNVGLFIRPSSIMGVASELHFGIIAPANVTPKERASTLEFNLSCISKVRGCGGPCETMPTAWRIAVQRFRNNELSMPKDWEKDLGCKEN